MEYTILGKSGLNVSRICLGCMGFGDATEGGHTWAVDEETSHSIIKKALELGVNFFDTAASYQNGTSEQHTGKALNALARRDEIVVATKFFPRSKEEADNGISGKQHIRQLLDKSLENLGMDYIDLYICHMWDYHTPIEEIMETLHEAVKSGKVRAIGMSNCYAWQLAKANHIAEKNGWSQFVSIQGHYNLMFREKEREMKPFCEDSGIAMTPYSPLASGRLVRDADFSSKRILEDNIQKSKYDNTVMQDSIIIERVCELAEKKGLSRTQIALGWLLTKVTSPIVGATKIIHIEEATKAVGVTFTEQEMAYLEECYVPHKLVGVMEFNHA